MLEQAVQLLLGAGLTAGPEKAVSVSRSSPDFIHS